MNSKNEIKKTFPIIQQVINIFPTILISIALSLGGAAIIVYVGDATDTPLWKLAKDPAQVIGYAPYIGMLSIWSGLLWMMSATICLLTARLMQKKGQPFRAYFFLMASGILNFILAVDDIFVLHDVIFVKLFNIPEFFFYFLYILVLAMYLMLFWRKIFEYDYLLFIIAFIILGMSRRLINPFPVIHQFLTTNDMLKYFGIVFWLAFFYRASMQEIMRLIKNKES